MLGCCRNNSECHCSCHDDPEHIMHCVPCCHQCPFCKTNIPTYAFNNHKQECSPKRFGIVGSRDFTNYEYMKMALDNLFFGYATFSGEPIYNCRKINSGGADGADSLAELYAKENSIEFEKFEPDRKRYREIGNQIYFDRNKLIVDNSDIIVAFWDGKSTGTLNTVNYAKRDGKKVLVYWPS